MSGGSFGYAEPSGVNPQQPTGSVSNPWKPHYANAAPMPAQTPVRSPVPQPVNPYMAAIGASFTPNAFTGTHFSTPGASPSSTPAPVAAPVNSAAIPGAGVPMPLNTNAPAGWKPGDVVPLGRMFDSYFHPGAGAPASPAPGTGGQQTPPMQTNTGTASFTPNAFTGMRFSKR